MTGSLVHSQADIIAQLLIDFSVGTDPTLSGTWPIYVSEEPDTPDNVITIYDTVGLVHGRSQIEGEIQEHEGIQIRIRGATHDLGFRKANDILTAVDITAVRDTVGVASVLGTGTTNYFVNSITRTSGILSLGDSPTSRRRIFTINAVVMLRQV